MDDKEKIKLLQEINAILLNACEVAQWGFTTDEREYEVLADAIKRAEELNKLLK